MGRISGCEVQELLEFVEAPLNEIVFLVLPLAVTDEVSSA